MQGRPVTPSVHLLLDDAAEQREMKDRSKTLQLERLRC
jgi:hypothetical protein